MTPREFERVIEQVWPQEVRICRARLSRYGLGDDAEDIVQRAIEELWRDGRYATLAEKSTTVGMAAWQAVHQCLIHVIYQRCGDRIRSRFGAERPATDSLQHLETQPTRENLTLERDIQRAMALLLPDTRRAVELVLMEGHTSEEAAQILEIPGRTLRRKLVGARKVLKAQLAEYNTAPATAAPQPMEVSAA